jgi:integrase
MFANYVQKKTIRSEKTAELYRNHIRLWAKSRGFSNPDDIVQEIHDKGLDPYTVLQEWINLLHSKGRAPKTILSYYTAVKGFLMDSDIDIRAEKLKSKVVLPEAYEVSTDRAPTREELRRILLRSRLHMKAAITTLASSGPRLGELTKLTVSDVIFGEPGQPSLTRSRPKKS